MSIRRTVPGLTEGDLFWRLKFLFGALHHGQEMWLRFDDMPKMPHAAGVPRLSQEGFIQQFIAFTAAGLRAAIPRPRKSKRSLSKIKSRT